MNTIQTWAALTVPTVAILIAILVSNNSVGKNVDLVRTEVGQLRLEILARLAVIEGDIRHFYQINGELKGRVDTLEKQIIKASPRP